MEYHRDCRSPGDASFVRNARSSKHVAEWHHGCRQRRAKIKGVFPQGGALERNDMKITKSMKMMMMLMVMSMMTRLMIRMMLMIAIKMKMMMYGARQVESLDNNVMMITHYS